MSWSYELMLLPAITEDTYVLVTSRGDSVAVRIYSSADHPPRRLDGRDLPSLRELRRQARGAGHPVLEERAHKTTDVHYWLQRIKHANSVLPNQPATQSSPDPPPRTDPHGPSLQAWRGTPTQPGGFQDHQGRPLITLEDWRSVHPERHWKKGYSAMELARRWSHAQGIPPRVADALRGGGIGPLTLRRAVAECRTPVPGGGRPSHTDLMVEATDASGALVVLGVEGKVSESFGPLVKSWLAKVEQDRSRENKEQRLAGLLDALAIDRPHHEIAGLRYQLLHRTYAAIAHAEGLGASQAVLVVHSFATGADAANQRAFATFLDAMGSEPVEPGAVASLGPRQGIELSAVWVQDRPLPLGQ